MRLFRVNDEQFTEYQEQDFKGEHREQTLESWLETNPDSIVEDGKLLIIGRQVTTNLKSFIDLLGIDREGNVAVLELKRERTPRETLAQALEYVSFAASLDYDQLEQLMQSHLGESISLSEYHRAEFALDESEAVSFNKDQRIVIVGQNITQEIRQTASFLRQKGLRVTCLEFKYFQTALSEQLLSVDIVVGKEGLGPGQLRTEPLTRWDENSFFQELAKQGADKTEIASKILDWSKKKGFRIEWNTAKIGGFWPVLDYPNIQYWFIQVRTNGNLLVQFRWLKLRPPFDNDAKRHELRERLNMIPGVALAEETINALPSINLSFFKDEQALNKLFDALQWAIDELNVYSHSV